MDMNSIHGMNAYTANVPMADTASVRNNNKEATSIEPAKESTQPVQEAFQVNITQEALALQTQNTEDLAKKDQEQQVAQQNQQDQSFQGRQSNQLDIIA